MADVENVMEVALHASGLSSLFSFAVVATTMAAYLTMAAAATDATAVYGLSFFFCSAAAITAASSAAAATTAAVVANNNLPYLNCEKAVKQPFHL